MNLRTIEIMNPFVTEIPKNATHVVFEVVDPHGNVKYIHIKKNPSIDEYELITPGQAYSNFQLKYPSWQIAWKADEGDWASVLDMIRSGVVTPTDVSFKAAKVTI